MSKPKVINETFQQYKSTVIADFVNNHAPFGENFQTLGDSWCDKCDFREEYAAILLLNTKTFLHCGLDCSKSHNTCLAFLEKLANKIAGYLALYIIHRGPIPEKQKSRGKLFDQIRDELKIKLFDENSHILSLKHQQEQKRELRSKPKRARIAAKKRAARKDAQDAYDISRQVKSAFFDAQHTPRR